MIVSEIQSTIDDQIVEMIEDDFTSLEIRETLGLSHDGLHGRIKRMRDKGRYIAPMIRGGQRMGHAFHYCSTVELDTEEASKKHLEDLKEAGHRPELTEYVITRERVTYLHSSASNRVSIYGSPAASCADCA